MKDKKYKVTLNIDIENIVRIENIHNRPKRHWSTIYKVIQQEFFDENDIFPEVFLKHFKSNANVPFNISTNVKNNLRIMATEQGSYAQLVMLCRKDLNITEENENKMSINSSSKVSLQNHSVGLILVLVGLKKLLAHVNLIYIRKYLKCMTKHKIKIQLKCL